MGGPGLLALDAVEELVFPEHLYRELVGHARRKLERRYLPGEEQAPKAYGLVGGRVLGAAAEVTHVVPLMRNLRYEPAVKSLVDRVMAEAAVPSETPLDRRGWGANPAEVLMAERRFDAAGATLLGGYHMHRVPWEHDPDRSTCTEVDTRLADGSGLWVLILSMVEPDRPVLRAYFEGRNHAEAPVRVSERP